MRIIPTTRRGRLLGAILPLLLAACGGDSPFLVAAGQSGPVASSQDAVFWIPSGGATGTDHGVVLLDAQVMRAPLSGGAVTSLASIPGNVGGVAVGTDALFFTSIHLERSDEMMRLTLHRLPLSGGSPTEISTIVSQVADIGGVAIDATGVYWVTDTRPGGSVLRMAPLAGSAPVTLFTAPDGESIHAVAAGGAAVYWTLWPETGGDGAVMKLSIEGGAPVTLATGQPNPFALAVDAAFVYWTNLNAEGAVMKVPIDGGAPVTLAAHQSLPASVAIDERFVYWTVSALPDAEATAGGALMKLPLSGGVPVVLAQGLNEPDSLALTANDVFWSDRDGLKRVAKSPPSTPR